MEIKINKTVYVGYIEIDFLDKRKVVIEYFDFDGETIKKQYAETLEQALEFIKGENN